MIEKERKFLLKHFPAELAGDPVLIDQAYLMLDDKQQLRVRLSQPKGIRFRTAHICFKQSVSDTMRMEYEYEIPYADGMELWASTPYKLTKTRYEFEYKGNKIFIDKYPERYNIPDVVEIEYENEIKEIPDFCGEEVTGKKEFTNIYIALNINK